MNCCINEIFLIVLFVYYYYFSFSSVIAVFITLAMRKGWSQPENVCFSTTTSTATTKNHLTKLCLMQCHPLNIETPTGYIQITMKDNRVIVNRISGGSSRPYNSNHHVSIYYRFIVIYFNLIFFFFFFFILRICSTVLLFVIIKKSHINVCIANAVIIFAQKPISHIWSPC